MNLYMSLAHSSRRFSIINEQLRRGLFQLSDKTVLMFNKNGLILNNQRNYKIAYQNSRNLTKDFKKTPRKYGREHKKPVDTESLFKSVKIMPNLANDNEFNLGEELGGKLEKRMFHFSHSFFVNV